MSEESLIPWGGGIYTRVHRWVDDALNGVKILASRQDEEWDAMVEGINNTLTRDGQNSPLADLPMATRKHLAVGNATARDQYGVVRQIQDNDYNHATDIGISDAYAISPSPSITAYTAGQTFSFIPSTTNTGPATLAVSALAAKSIKRRNGTDLEDGDITAGEPISVLYDGTNFRLTTFTNEHGFDLNQLDGTLAVENGGTGAETEEHARTNLGLGSAAQSEITTFGDTLINSADALAAHGTLLLPNSLTGQANKQLVVKSDETGYTHAREWVMLANHSFGGQADMSYVLPSGYLMFKWVMVDLFPGGVSGVNLYLRTSTNGGVSYDQSAGAYDWAHVRQAGTPTSVDDGSTSSDHLRIAQAIGALAGQGFEGEITAYNPFATNTFKKFTYEGVYHNGASALIVVHGGGSRRNTDPINAVQFDLTSLATFTGGRLMFFGYPT